MDKVIWFDTETTGLDPIKNDIIQIACLIEIDKKIVDEIQLKMQPQKGAMVSKEAMDVHGYQIKDLKTFMLPNEAYLKIVSFLDKHVDKFNKTDKLLSAGQNVKFDIEFLRNFFIKNNNDFFGSYFDYHFIDLQAITALLVRNNLLNVENYKLTTVAKEVCVDLGENAHDALFDIKATREVFLKYENLLFGDNT